MVEEATVPARRLERDRDKIDPVAKQMASYLVCLRYDARFALERTSLRGSCYWARLVAKGSAIDQLLVGDPIVLVQSCRVANYGPSDC
jgi:hypothetical protein